MKRLLLTVLGLALAQVALADELGRLFFSPEQRAVLDSRRAAHVPDRAVATPIVASPTTRVDGYVRRSSGPTTIWVNGESVDPASGEARIEGRAPDAPVTVSIGDSNARVRLKPGEELDRSNGEVHDVIGGGQIRIGRPRN